MKRLTAVLLTLTLLFSLLVLPSSPVVSAATKAELEQKISDIDEKIAENKSKIDELKKKKEAQQQVLDTLNSQISANQEKVEAVEAQVQVVDGELKELDKQIEALKKEIAVLNKKIAKTNAKINDTKAEIDASKGELSTKLRNSYLAGNDSTLKILMGSSSLASFLTHLEMMKRMSENDKKVIDAFKAVVLRLRDQRAVLNGQKEELNTKKTEVQAVRTKTLEKKNELRTTQQQYQTAIRSLERSYSEVNTYVSQLDQNSATYENYIKNLQSERAAADKEIDRIIASMAAKASTSSSSSGGSHSGSTANMQTGQTYSGGGTWVWPLGSASTYISSGFGNRSASISGWSFHGGIDITGGGIYGKPVFASRAGTVIAAIWGTTGYGRYIILDHGDGYTTVYGHCSNLTVSQGQHVNQGQQIANVGSTGNSTGPHLHFEVRYNGVKQNPLNYVSH